MDRPSPAPPPSFSARGSVFNGVIQQIENHAAQKGFVCVDGRFGGFIEIQTDLFCERQRSGRMHTLAGEFIEIEIAWLERILSGVGTGKGKKILDDVRESRGLLVKNAKRFAVFLSGAGLLG